MNEESQRRADDLLAEIEVFYPTYLVEAGLTDNLITKAGYYETMILAMMDAPTSYRDVDEHVQYTLRRRAQSVRAAIVLPFLKRNLPQ